MSKAVGPTVCRIPTNLGSESANIGGRQFAEIRQHAFARIGPNLGQSRANAGQMLPGLRRVWPTSRQMRRSLGQVGQSESTSKSGAAERQPLRSATWLVTGRLDSSPNISNPIVGSIITSRDVAAGSDNTHKILHTYSSSRRSLDRRSEHTPK